MFKNFIMCMFVMCMLVISGCVQTSFTEFSLSELEEFQYGMENKDFLMTDGYLIFEISSENEYNKSKGFIVETLSNYFINPRNIMHSKKDSKDLVIVQVDVPILRTMNDDLVAMYYIYNNDTLYFKLSPQKLSELNSEMSRAMGYGLNKVRNLEISLTMHNDSNMPSKYTIPDMFVNNVPTFGDRFELAIDGKIDLTLTNFQVERALADPIEIFKM